MLIVAVVAVAFCLSAPPVVRAAPITLSELVLTNRVAQSRRAPLGDGSGYAGHLYYGLDKWREELRANPNNPHLMNETAIALRMAGHYQEAEELARSLVTLRKSTLGPEAAEVARSLNNLAVIYANQERYADAEPLYQESLAIWRKQRGPDHCEVARVLNNLGDLSHKLGQNAESERYYQQSLAIWQKNFGDKHPEFARTLGNLGELYTDCGWYNAAEKLLLQALAIWEKKVGPEHPDYASCLRLLGVLYKEQRQHAAAEPLYKESLAIWIAVMGDDHPEVGRVLKNLGDLYEHRGQVAMNCSLSTTNLGLGTHFISSIVSDPTTQVRISANTSAPVVINVLLSSWKAWRPTRFTAEQLATPAISDMTADPDGDGIANLLEYALNLNPLAASTAGLPSLGQTNNFLTLTYTRRKPLTDLQYLVEATADLTGGWSTNGISETVLSDSGTLQTVLATDAVSLKDAPKRFLRLRVIWTKP